MSHRKYLSRLALAALAAAALAAPAATAMPADPIVMETLPPPSTQDDRRSENAADPSPPPVAHPRAIPPTWPENPEPIGRSQPQSAVDGGDGGGTDVPVVLIAIGGALVLAGGTAYAVTRQRTRAAH
jgi:hypothetical protein